MSTTVKNTQDGIEITNNTVAHTMLVAAVAAVTVVWVTKKMEARRYRKFEKEYQKQVKANQKK